MVEYGSLVLWPENDEQVEQALMGDAYCENTGMVTIKFESGLASFQESLNQVSSVSLLMTSSPSLANEGLFELTQRPSLTRAVSLSFAETTEEPGCSQVKFA